MFLLICDKRLIKHCPSSLCFIWQYNHGILKTFLMHSFILLHLKLVLLRLMQQQCMLSYSLSKGVFLYFFPAIPCLSVYSTIWHTPKTTNLCTRGHICPSIHECSHFLIATSSRLTHHVKKLESPINGFLNMTLTSLYSSGLHSHQVYKI